MDANDRLSSEAIAEVMSFYIEGFNVAIEQIEGWIAQKPETRINKAGESLLCYPCLDGAYSMLSHMSRFRSRLMSEKGIRE